MICDFPGLPPQRCGGFAGSAVLERFEKSETASCTGFAKSTYVQGIWDGVAVRDIVSLSLLNQTLQLGEGQRAHLSVLCSRSGPTEFISALSMEAIQVRGATGLVDVPEANIVTSKASPIY